MTDPREAAADALLRELLVSVQTLTHLLVAKNVFTRSEYLDSERWFALAFEQLADLAAKAASDSASAPIELIELQRKITAKLFGDPCPS